MKDEATYICQSCGEEIVIPVDRSAGFVQDFVEDCPVCCHPHQLQVVIDESSGEVTVTAELAE